MDPNKQGHVRYPFTINESKYVFIVLMRKKIILIKQINVVSNWKRDKCSSKCHKQGKIWKHGKKSMANNFQNTIN